MRRNGFSLVEVVVVMLIIGALMAVLLPGLTRAKDYASRIDCGASLHQVGIGVSSYTIGSFNQLPTRHGSSNLSFDQFWMVNSDEAQVNLGLLQPYVDGARAFYCPTQTSTTSPALALNSTKNPWNNGKGKGKGKGKGNSDADDDNGNGKGKAEPSDDSTSTQDSTVILTGLNSSFDTRPTDNPTGPQPSWTQRNYENKVIYSDFTGVDDWIGRDRFLGTRIKAAHRGEGVNRLFGDGSVLWANASRLAQQRVVNATEPTAQDMANYYRVLDVVP